MRRGKVTKGAGSSQVDPAPVSPIPVVRYRKVAIVGFAETTRHLAPYDDETFQIFSLNHRRPDVKRWDYWFDQHTPEWSKAHMKPEVWADHEAFLKTAHAGPILMIEAYPEYPSAFAYPLGAVLERFGRRYFTNGIAYMIAYALYHGVDELHLYGVDMRHDSEYGMQRPCAEFWLGIAQGMGVKVVLPEGCALLQSDGGLYGYEEQAGTWAEAERAILDRVKQLEAVVESHRTKADIETAHMQAYDGARQELASWVHRFRQRARGGVL